MGTAAWFTAVIKKVPVTQRCHHKSSTQRYTGFALPAGVWLLSVASRRGLGDCPFFLHDNTRREAIWWSGPKQAIVLGLLSGCCLRSCTLCWFIKSSSFLAMLLMVGSSFFSSFMFVSLFLSPHAVVGVPSNKTKRFLKLKPTRRQSALLYTLQTYV